MLGTLKVGEVNIIDALGTKVNTTSLSSYALKESPTFTGTVTAAALTVSGNLLIGTTNVLTELGTKSTTANLNLKTDLTTTNNSAVAWSEGLAGAGYHYLNTETDALVVRTNSGAISANFLGDAGGAAYDGKTIFYKVLKCNF